MLGRPISAVVFEVKGQIRSVPRELAAKIWVAAQDDLSPAELRVDGERAMAGHGTDLILTWGGA